MKNRLLKIAEDTALILELKIDLDLGYLDGARHRKFRTLHNYTLRAQKDLAYDFLISEGRTKDAKILKSRSSYISQVIKITNSALMELKELYKIKAEDKYFKQF